MKYLNRIAAALFLMAGAASGLRAAIPETGAVMLPEIGAELGAVLQRIDLVVAITDGGGKTLHGCTDFAVWKPDPKPGAWQKKKGNVSPRLIFPLRQLEDRQDIKIRFDYKVSYRSPGNTSREKSLAAQEFLPIGGGEDFPVSAPFPIDMISIDGTGLEWGKKSGLAGVQWQLVSGVSPRKNFRGVLKEKGQQADAIVIAKEGALTATIRFVCYGGRKIDWAGNGKDLRKSGLNIVLETPPDCSR